MEYLADVCQRLDLDTIQKNYMGVWQYLTGNVADESIEIYACWNGEFMIVPIVIVTLE